MQQAEVFIERPPLFSPDVEASGCYVEWGGKLLFLFRAKEKAEGNCWGVPGGKLEVGETPEEAAIRELKEETGIEVIQSQIQFLRSLYMKKQKMRIIFHLIHVPLEKEPIVLLNHESLEARWVTEKELFTLPLVQGSKEAYAYYRESLNS